MPQSVRHLLLALVAVVATVALPRPALAQSAPDNGVGPAIPVLMQSVSFINEADDQAATGTQAPPPQKSHHNGPGIGVKGGWAFAGFSGATNFQANTGWQIGLFLGGNRTGVFGVATEITFIQRNASAVFNTTISSSSKALEIPLLFRFNIGSHNLNRFIFYFMLGPAIDINLEKFTDVVQNSGYDINLIFSGGVEITRFIIEFRYNKGLKNLASNLGDSIDVKTHAFLFLIGVRFN
jgi:hypothetical protein